MKSPTGPGYHRLVYSITGHKTISSSAGTQRADYIAEMREHDSPMTGRTRAAVGEAG
jgi:hypothetical protein